MAKRGIRTGGLAAWSVNHPIGVVMIGLAVAVVGLFAFGRLAVDLLPQIIYPTVRVRILDPGVPARIMEDRITRQLEEQLAITEDAIGIDSQTSEGNVSVNLYFQYGKDMDLALRDASNRLDRAKRFLPDTIDPPIIFKMDPSQIPVTEFVVASPLRGPGEVRDWVDYVFAKWFVNLPGVAAVEVGGGVEREIQVLPDPARLAAVGLSTADLVSALQANNQEAPAGRLQSGTREYSGRTAGRFESVAQIGQLPLRLPDGGIIHLADIAEIADTYQDERVRARLNGNPGVKVSIQKQPTANTVAVVDAVKERLAWLQNQGLLPTDIRIDTVHDQSIYIRNSLRNAAAAALSGALLAMGVVYLFLGHLRRTLVVGTAIPLSILVTFLLMDFGGLTLNIMTLGGLAVGIGMVLDNTIVMLENIYRHQREGESGPAAGQAAAAEVNSAIVASTSTNLAAIVPFLFIGGLTGLLFRELIFTVSAAIFASMVVALTLVPSLAARVPAGQQEGRMRTRIDAVMSALQRRYRAALAAVLSRPVAQAGVVAALLLGLAAALPTFVSEKQVFLPSLDDGRITVRITADSGIALDEMDASVRRLEELFARQPEVLRVFTLAGGSVFGRTQRETSNQSTIDVQLRPLTQRGLSSEEWIKRMQREIGAAQMAGLKVRMRTGNIRGIRVSQGEDDVSLRIAGPDLDMLDEIGQELVRRLSGLPGLRNITHSAEEIRHELAASVDRERVAALGMSVGEVAQALRVALDGVVVTDYLDGDRSHGVRLRLPQSEMDTVQSLESVLVSPAGDGRGPLYVADVARVELVPAPAEIRRDNQTRIVEVTASLDAGAVLGQVRAQIDAALADLRMPDGYSLYDAGAARTLQEGRRMTQVLLGLALFLVFVVMAVQYESLRNPLVILLSVPFAGIGVALGVHLLQLPLSMPIWLGMIMLAGIVVNNAIVLVEYIEILRSRGRALGGAVVEAAGLRLRPILMTTLTTVVGLVPLALGLGEGAEMLRPLAVTIVFGLSFSMLVSLVLVPIIYRLLAASGERRHTLGAEAL